MRRAFSVNVHSLLLSQAGSAIYCPPLLMTAALGTRPRVALMSYGLGLKASAQGRPTFGCGEQSKRGRCLTQAGSKWAFESAAVKKQESGKCETNDGWRAWSPANSAELHCYPLLLFLSTNIWTHLFPARTPPGPRRHSDTRPMPPRYRPSFVAEVGRRERMACLTSNMLGNVSVVCLGAHFVSWLLLLRTNYRFLPRWCLSTAQLFALN